MKKLGLFILLLTLLVTQSFSASPSYTATDAPYEWELVSSYGTRTSITAIDSATLITKQAILPGWQYIMVIKDSVAATADSLSYRADAYGSDNTTIMNSQTFGKGYTAIGCQVHYIDLGNTLMTNYIRVKAIKLSATVVAKVVRWELYKRRPVEIQKPWTIR